MDLKLDLRILAVLAFFQAIFLSGGRLAAQFDAPPLPPPSMPARPLTIPGPPSNIPGSPPTGGSVPINPAPLPTQGPPGAMAPLPVSSIPDQAPISPPPGSTGVPPPASGVSGVLRRLPDPTASYQLSPSQTDLGGLLVPNLLPGITGPDFKDDEKAKQPPATGLDRDGFYFNQELYILKPNFIGTLQIQPAQSPWNGGILPQPAPFTTLVFPTAPLEWVVSPTFDLGYRLPGKQGEFALNYQFLVSQGSSTGSYYGISSQVNSRITQNEVDLLYRSALTPFGPRLDFRYEIGAKMGFLFYDALAANALGQGHATNYFFGGGPRFRADAEYAITQNKRWKFVNGLEITALMGQIQQSFSNSVGNYQFAVSAPKSTTTLPVLKWQTGFQWTPSFSEGFSLMAGFELDEYWQLANQAQSSGRLQNLGVILQGRLDF